MKSKPIIRFILEYICVNSFLYFATRIFEILITLLIDGYGVHNGVRLESFIEFSLTSFIIGSILSCCALRWEYRIRHNIRIQQDRQMQRDLERELQKELELTPIQINIIS